jgi:hypothetical protein
MGRLGEVFLLDERCETVLCWELGGAACGSCFAKQLFLIPGTSNAKVVLLSLRVFRLRLFDCGRLLRCWKELSLQISRRCKVRRTVLIELCGHFCELRTSSSVVPPSIASSTENVAQSISLHMQLLTPDDALEDLHLFC